MDYMQMKDTLEQMANENYEEFVKALISFEKDLDDNDALENLYNNYMENDDIGLLNDEFDHMIAKIEN